MGASAATPARTSARADRRGGAGDRVRHRDRRAGGLVFAVGLIAARDRLPARALRDVRPRAPGAAGGLPRRSSGWRWRRTTATSDDVLLALVLDPADVLPGGGPAARGGAPAISVTMLGICLDRPRARPRRDAARPAARQRDRGRRPGRDVPRRHGRLPRRPRVRLAARWRRGSRPNKTWEGLGRRHHRRGHRRLVRGALPGLASGPQALLLGFAIALAAPVGDLFESYLKRDAGTKDTGTLFGAHGGALDRLDAVLFTIVAGYYVWTAMM